MVQLFHISEEWFLLNVRRKSEMLKYERFAEYWLGNKAVILVGVCNLFTLLEGVTSFKVFIKTLVPLLLTMVLGSDVLGSEQFEGKTIWEIMIMIYL